jgi:hypothetical protein
MISRTIVRGEVILSAYSPNVLWLKRRNGGCGWWCNVVEFYRQANRPACVPCLPIAFESLEKSSQPPQDSTVISPHLCGNSLQRHHIQVCALGVRGPQAMHCLCSLDRPLPSSAAWGSSQYALGPPGTNEKNQACPESAAFYVV